MGTILQDIRYFLRTLRKSPGFAAVVIVTLALGIGANTAIFSIVDGVLLRPLPYLDPERLVRIVDSAPGSGLSDIGMSVPELEDLRDRSGIFDDVSAVWPVDGNITGTSHPERAEVLAVSPGYFTLLGVQPQLGRLFGPEDKAAGFAETAVISDAFWRGAFGGDTNILGHRLLLDGDAYTIVGVAPAEFRHPGRTLAGDVEMWVTAGFSAAPFPAPPPRSSNFLPGAIGRIRKGIPLRQVQAQLDTFAAQLRAEFPNDYRPEARFSIQLEPLKDSLTGKVRPMLLALLGAVAMMLLIGCANIANLLMVRAAGRGREVAVRQSLGAGRHRLVCQMLTESVFLAFAAGTVGVVAAASGLRLLLYLAPSKLPRLSEIAIDPRVLMFSAGLCLITGVLFGMVPAVQTSGFDLAAYLKDGGRGSSGNRRQSHASAMLVAAEFAVCLTLMIGAGLLVRSFWNLVHADPGFNPQNTLTARIWLPVPNDPTKDPYAKLEDRAVFVREVLRRVKSLPGVASASMSTAIPLDLKGAPIPVTVENPASAPADMLAEIFGVSPDYFDTLQTPLRQGRGLMESDQGRAQLAALVDQTTASRFWPGQSALGKRIKLGRTQSKNPWAIVVGIVGDIRQDSVSSAAVPHVYFSIYQRSGKQLGLEVRGFADPTRLGEAVRAQIQAVDPNLPVFGVQTFSSLVSASVTAQRFSAEMMAAFACLALLLAAIGIYGVLAYFVGQRTREIGVRMALGATSGSVIRLVLLEGLRPIAAGMAIGLAGSWMFGRLLSQLIYGLSATDPLVFIAVPPLLAFAAFLASYIPAYQATRIDPAIALRAD